MEIQGKMNKETGEIMSEFNHNVIACARKHCGKWTGNSWKFSTEIVEDIFEKLFGKSDKIVKVIITNKDVTTNDQILAIGGYSVCQRKGRDTSVRLFRGVELIAGSFSSSGGSMRHPSVDMDDDVKLTMYVRQDFAERLELSIIDETITNDPFANFSTIDLVNELKKRNFNFSTAV